MRVCRCEVPHESPNPRNYGTCGRCLGGIARGQKWEITDETHDSFLDRAEGAIAAAENWPADEPPPPHWLYFRELCLDREREGRHKFGFKYLSRDNTKAGLEEDSDGFNYLYMDWLKALRDGDDEEWALMLDTAYHDFKAYEGRLKLKQKRMGAP